MSNLCSLILQNVELPFLNYQFVHIIVALWKRTGDIIILLAHFQQGFKAFTFMIE